MMKTILAPVDFSPSSLNALHYAADFAASLNSELILLNVLQAPISASDVPMPEYVFEEMLETANHDLEEWKNELSQRVNNKIPISKEVRIGTVEGQIREIADEKKPFAIVMGFRPEEAMERYFFGSTALSASRHLSYPILIIPENMKFNPIRKVGMACDLENIQPEVIQSIKAWLSEFNPKLHIVHISKGPGVESDPNLRESHSIQKQFTEFQAEFHFLHNEKPEDGLDEFARSQQLDLLIILPRKHGFWGLFDKKHTNKIISHQHLPIASFHTA